LNAPTEIPHTPVVALLARFPEKSQQLFSLAEEILAFFLKARFPATDLVQSQLLHRYSPFMRAA
jgi:hypothetical protein